MFDLNSKDIVLVFCYSMLDSVLCAKIFNLHIKVVFIDR